MILCSHWTGRAPRLPQWGPARLAAPYGPPHRPALGLPLTPPPSLGVRPGGGDAPTHPLHPRFYRMLSDPLAAHFLAPTLAPRRYLLRCLLGP